MNNSKERLSGINFARSICTIGIIIFHYFCYTKGSFKFLFLTANSSWGFMHVTSFYAISGTVLYYNYPKIKSLKTFYFKRWKSIFPFYYISFLFFFIRNAFKFNKLFYNGHWSKLIFTLFGMDGFFCYRFSTYNLVGEWFLGSIIILYILYPLLSFLMNKNILIIHFMACAGYSFMILTNFFIIENAKNIITCIYSFYFGMLSLKFSNLFFKNKKTFIISFFILVFLCLIRLTDSEFILIVQTQGFSLFIVLVQIGEFIMLTRIKFFIKEIRILSYCIFLLHHNIILDILKIYNPDKWYLHLILLVITIISIILCSKILFFVVNIILKSYYFKKIESMFIKA